MTPGALNPDVRQRTIRQDDLCAGVDADGAAADRDTSQLKVEQLRASGLAGGPRDYQEDHLISLEARWPPDRPRNLGPEPHRARSRSTGRERAQPKVCSGS